MNAVKWLGVSLLAMLFLLIALLISAPNLNWAREIVTQQVSDKTGRNLTIKGNFIIDWSLTPLIRIEQIQFENADWSKQPNMVELAALDMRIDLIELLKGRMLFPEITLTKPHIILQKSSKGERNWDLQIAANDPKSKTEMPLIERLRIVEGHLNYEDLTTDTAITTAFATTMSAARDEELTELQAQGKLNGHPLLVNLNAGPLVALREAEIPYPLTLSLQAGQTSIKVEGTLIQPLQLKGLDLQFLMQGPNPDQLEL